MSLHYIGTIDEFATGVRKIVNVNGKSIGVFNLSGTYHAVLNYCPHQGAPLCEGVVASWVTSPTPGVFEYDKEGEIVRCPWHAWEFDIKTGCMVVDAKVRTKTYDVVVETFEVSVEKNKVYIDM